MAEFLQTKGIVQGKENLIANAKERVILVSPYLQISDEFSYHIKRAIARGIQVSVVFGKKELKTAEFEAWDSIWGINIRFLKILHAKYYFNGENIIITSMNLYKFSESNLEMGVWLNKNSDANAFDKAKLEIELILKNSNPTTIGFQQRFSFDKSFIPVFGKELSTNGSCIHCSGSISSESGKICCRMCSNLYYQYHQVPPSGSYCYTCGKKSKTSLKYPECYPCYKEVEQKKFHCKTG
jgi:PLD-like domain